MKSTTCTESSISFETEISFAISFEVNSERAKRIKAKIIKDSVDFEGSTPVGELVSSLGISRQTYYNYKKQILEKEGDDNENV